ncbi:hypothetical protein GCM10009550_15050 [Actinocorallia libanotica]|uniref:Transposase n=1 Tax=Actinocorallia libanotica TaxID=46162 RepID=A0ABN1QIJ4_9ACTN
MRVVAGSLETEWATINAVATRLGIGTTKTLRTWIRQVQEGTGRRPGEFCEEVREAVSDLGGAVRSKGEAARKGQREGREPRS